MAKIGFGKALPKKWIKIDPNNKEAVIRIVQDLDDTDGNQLRKCIENPNLEAHDKKTIDMLKKRQLLNTMSLKTYKVTKGPNF